MAPPRGRGLGAVMRFCVSARAPHVVGALLLIGSVAVVGAAVLAWRSLRHGKKGTEHHRGRKPAKGKVLDGGVVEDGKVWVINAFIDENRAVPRLFPFQCGKVTEENHLIHTDNEIVADQLDRKPEEKIDQNSGGDPIKVNMDNTDKGHVEKIDQNSSRNHVEITTHDMGNEHVEKIDDAERIDLNSSSDPAEIVMQEVIIVCLVSAVLNPFCCSAWRGRTGASARWGQGGQRGDDSRGGGRGGADGALPQVSISQ